MTGKISLILLTLTVLFTVAACADDNASGSDSSEKKEDFTFAMSGLYPPFNYKDNGELVGFDVEIGNALAKEMGMNPKPVTNPWETILSALKSNRFHAIIGSMAITDERKKEVSFTSPYYESGAQIFVSKERKDIQSADDIKGKKIGVVVSSTFEDLAKEYSDQVSTYNSDVTALQDLLVEGRLDAVITDKLVGMYAINQNDLGIKPAGEALYTDQMGIAVNKDDKQLLEELNQALEAIKEDGTYEKISKKYFGENVADK